MTVSKTTSSATFFGNGATTVFSLQFYVAPTDTLRLYAVVAAGTMTPVLSGFSFVGNQTTETTALTFTSAPTSGAEFYAVRETAPSQLVSLKGQVSYNPTVVEGVWDKLSRLIQELQTGTGKVLRATTAISPIKLLAGRSLMVNTAGTEIVCGPPMDEIMSAAESAAAAAISTSEDRKAVEAATALLAGFATRDVGTFTTDSTVSNGRGPYALPYNPLDQRYLDLTLNGLRQVPDRDFTVVSMPSASSGWGVQFTVNLPSGLVCDYALVRPLAAGSLLDAMAIRTNGNIDFFASDGTTIALQWHAANQALRHTPRTVASLPTAAIAGAGARAFVSDASAPTFGSTVVGGGAVNAPVYSDGTNWRIG